MQRVFINKKFEKFIFCFFIHQILYELKLITGMEFVQNKMLKIIFSYEKTNLYFN